MDAPSRVAPRVARCILAWCLLVAATSAGAQTAEARLAWPGSGAPAASSSASAADSDDAQLRALADLLLADEASMAGATPAQRAHLLLVAGRNAQAQQAITVHMTTLQAQEPANAPRWVPYLLLAQARASGADEAAGYARAYQQQVGALADLPALQAQYWFVANLPRAERELQQSLQTHRAAQGLTAGAARELISRAAFVQTYRAVQKYNAPLEQADHARRYLIDETVLIPAGDGVQLSAQIARSRTHSGPLPTAMIFTIYTEPARNLGDALQAAARGYVGVVVDARGKGRGTGTVAPYEHEGEDAAAAIGWISRQPWSDGRVAMYGGSYNGFAAWSAAGQRPPALKAIAAYVAAIPGQGLPMENNVFLTANYAWPFYVANTPLLDDALYDQNERWSNLGSAWYLSGRPYREIDQVDGLPNPWLQRWLQHPAYDAYWQRMVPYAEQFAAIDIPVLSITGYYDDGQISALHYYNEHLRYRPQADHTLVIGPYDHRGAQSSHKPMELRGLTVDPSAQFDTRELTFQWLDHVLRGAPKPALLADKVNFQLMGADRWGHAPTLQAAAGAGQTLYLSAAGAGPQHALASERPRDGFLRQRVDFADRSTERHRYYPWPIVRDALEGDTGLVFVSAPLATPMDLVGSFSAQLKLRINKRDVDLTLTLYEQEADGTLVQLSYYVGRASYARDMSTRQLLQPGRWTELPLTRTRMTARRLAAGSRLLLVADVLKDSQHQVNHGTGKDVSDESVADAGEPLLIDWHAHSTVHLPLAPAQ